MVIYVYLLLHNGMTPIKKINISCYALSLVAAGCSPQPYNECQTQHFIHNQLSCIIGCREGNLLFKVPVNCVIRASSHCLQGRCDSEKCLLMATNSSRVSQVEFVLGLGNSSLERSAMEYYIGDLTPNSKFAKE